MKRFVIGVLLVLLLGAGAGWWQRTALRTWHVLRGLDRADEAEREAWARRAADLGEPAVEPLLERLAGPDDRACQNAAFALGQLGQSWSVEDPRAAELAGKQARLFAQLSPPAQVLVLEGLAGWFTGGAPAEGLMAACARVLGDASGSTAANVQLAALQLAGALLKQPGHAEALPAARALTAAGLRSSAAANRPLRAVQLSLHLGNDMLRQVEGLLRDPSAEVRRAVLLVVGPAEAVVRDEGLLPGLHDADAEVRRLTEAALKARGLRPEHLELGRLLTHPHHAMRLRVLDQLGETADVDPGVWLRRLSHDRSPAVRAAAARFMGALEQIDLSDRLDQMSRGDPSPSVAQLARYYLSRKRDPNPPAVER